MEAAAFSSGAPPLQRKLPLEAAAPPTSPTTMASSSSSSLFSNSSTAASSHGEEKVASAHNESLDWSVLMRGKLYDRDQETKQLLDCFSRIVSSKNEQQQRQNPTNNCSTTASTTTPTTASTNELVLITGPSGNGKSALAKLLKEHVLDNVDSNGCFLSGKFDQLQRPSSSLDAFVQAFTQYARSIQMLLGKREWQQVQRDCHEALGPKEQALLIQMIPALKTVFSNHAKDHNKGTMEEDDTDDENDPDILLQQQVQLPHSSSSPSSSTSNNKPSTDMTGLEVQKRVQFVFATFLRAIASPQHPIVLFLDDLQWAPKEALDLLAALSTNTSIQGFMVLGAARGNEVSYDDELAIMLRRLEDNYELYITEIPVHCLSQTAVQQLLADLFHLPLDHDDDDASLSRCLPLAKAVHSHTQGNPFFTIQFIRSLSEHGLIRVSSADGQFDVDYSNLDSLFVSTGAKDIVGLLCAKIQQLPLELQELLQVAASLGAEFDLTVIDRVWQRTKESCSYYLDMGQEEGFLAPARSSSHRDTTTATVNTRFAFVHDKAQEAAYSMIEDKASFHLMICRRVWNSYETPEELLANAPLLVNQLCHGVDLIEKESERISAAQLCGHAGKLAIASSSFPTAAFYFETGRRLLGKRPWRDSYDLALSLFSMSAEVEYAIGNLKTSDELVDQVLNHAQSLEDKIQAYKTRIANLGTQNRIEEAIETSLNILNDLNEPIPHNAGTRHIIMGVVKTSMMLRGKADNDLMNLKRMDDTSKSAAMNILNASWIHVFVGSPILCPLWAIKMMQITLRHGLCAISGVAFASYGFLLASFGQIDESVRFADLGLKVLRNFKGQGQAWVPRVNMLAHVFCYSSKHAMRFSYQPLINGYRQGMVTGDTEIALSCLQFCSHVAVYSSMHPLWEIFRELKMNKEMFIAYNQTSTNAYHDVLLQMVANLLGHSPDHPARLSGEHMTFDGTMRLAEEQGLLMLKFETYALNLVLAYVVGDLKVAERMLGFWNKEVDEKMVMRMALRMTKLFQGLTLLALADGCSSWSQRRRLLAEAKRVVKAFRKDSLVSPRNCLMKLHILEAEYTIVAHKKLEKGLKLFNSGIEHARKEGALMELGVACERAAVALRNHGRGNEAISFYGKALAHYEKWGAKVKADQIKAILDSPFFIRGPTSSAKDGGGIAST